ncbi:MAG: hypothetical protein ACOZAM_27200 [Pseudomonadota bacterium]
MAEDKSFALRWERWQQGWDDFTPSKTTWVWSCLGSSILTVAIGFTVCGWMTRAQADSAATQAATAARAELVARACLWNAANGPDLGAWLANLKSENAEGILAKLDRPPAPTDLCADELATVHSPDAAKPKG